MLDQNQINTIKSEISSGLRGELQTTLQATASDIQGVIDRMGADWQARVGAMIEAKTAELKETQDAVIRTSAFLGLFNEHSAEFLAQVDAKAPTTVLQRSLYKACDKAINDMPVVGKRARFFHLTTFEVASAGALAALSGGGLYVAATSLVARIKARRAAAQAEGEYQG